MTTLVGVVGCDLAAGVSSFRVVMLLSAMTTLVSAEDIGVDVVVVGDNGARMTDAATNVTSRFLGVGDGADESRIVADLVGGDAAVLSLLDGLHVLLGLLLGLVFDKEHLGLAGLGWGKGWQDNILSIVGFLHQDVDERLLFVLGLRWNLWHLWGLVSWGLNEDDLVVLLSSGGTSRQTNCWGWEILRGVVEVNVLVHLSLGLLETTLLEARLLVTTLRAARLLLETAEATLVGGLEAGVETSLVGTRTSIILHVQSGLGVTIVATIILAVVTIVSRGDEILGRGGLLVLLLMSTVWRQVAAGWCAIAGRWWLILISITDV